VFEESRELDQHELEMVVGGNSDPTDPVGNATGDVEPNSKATPIIL
jgi:hypothetical protein